MAMFALRASCWAGSMLAIGFFGRAGVDFAVVVVDDVVVEVAAVLVVVVVAVAAAAVLVVAVVDDEALFSPPFFVSDLSPSFFDFLAGVGEVAASSASPVESLSSNLRFLGFLAAPSPSPSGVASLAGLSSFFSSVDLDLSAWALSFDALSVGSFVDMGRRVDKFGGVPGVPTNNDRGGKKGLDVCLTADALRRASRSWRRLSE